MSASTRRTAARGAAVALAAAALVLGLAVAPASAHEGGNPGDGEAGDGHPYVWQDGRLHVRPQVEPHSGSSVVARRRAVARRRRAHAARLESVRRRLLGVAHHAGARRRQRHPVPHAVDTRARTTSTRDISPDGRSVLFERDGDDGSIEVVITGIDGTGERVVDLGCTDPCVGDVAPTWGPDGRTIWFTRVIGPFDDASNAGSAVLWTADVSGRHVQPGDPGRWIGVYEEYAAKFLPNGDRVFIRLANPRRSVNRSTARSSAWIVVGTSSL